jgi:hypothetical protein
MTAPNFPKVSLYVDTKAFADPLFLAGSAISDILSKSPFECVRVNFSDRKIKPCVHCESCNSKEVACSYLDDFDPLVEDLTTSRYLLLLTDAHPSKSFLSCLEKFHALESYPKEWGFAGVFLFFLGTEEELREFIEHAYLEALMILSPEHSQVFHYEKWDEKAEQELNATLLPLLKK